MIKKFVSIFTIIVTLFSFQLVIFGDAQAQTSQQQASSEQQGASLSVNGYFIEAVNYIVGEEGLTLDAIAIYGFVNSNETSLKLDSTYGAYPITIISTNAFMGYENLESVNVPAGFKEIRSGAFENCEKLKDVYLPESIEYISPDAFLGSTNVVINAPLHSYAEKFAEENGLQFVNTSPAEKFSVEVDKEALMDSFRVMGLGMAGIFIVIIVIYLSLVVMNGAFKPKKD
ncbi:MAG: leucine-rich repeat domain-containing protein [Ruminococcus sp.]|jgi:hypothetical protein|nr:leucine-rich repeat domain-containing protein [Ruminococcus sp.]